MELLPDFSQDERTKNIALRSRRNPVAVDIREGRLELIGAVRQHSIYYEDRNNARFYAVDDLTGLVSFMVDGDMRTNSGYHTFSVNVLQGRRGSRLKAYQFYRAILQKMPIIFVAEQQSYGGLRTWQELARYRDIEIFGWLDGKPINVDPTDPEETHASEDDVYGSGSYDLDASKIMRMKLVAHRKIRNGR